MMSSRTMIDGDAPLYSQLKGYLGEMFSQKRRADYYIRMSSAR